MDLSAKQIHLLCIPTGAFFDIDATPPWHSRDDILLDGIKSSPNLSSELWDRSTTNPAKRIETLDPVINPRWRIDGSDNQGTQFHIVPLFMRHPTPIRIDVYIPSQDRHPPYLRSALDSAWTFAIRDARVGRLGLARQILRALELWTDEEGQHEIETKWQKAPFGSRIVIDSLAADPKQMKCRVINDLESERQMLSLAALKDMWEFPSTIYPGTVDISQLTLLYQVHDTISLVSLPESLAKEQVVFKSTIHDVKYLYHELKLLLSMPKHPNIMQKPLYLVTGKDRYGGDDKLFGFILPYLPRGNLADIVSRRKQHGQLLLKDQFRWARQIVEGLKVVNASSAKFYSELKADNLLLDRNDNVLLIDFEQMGNWITYSAPEIHYLEYCARLSRSDLVPEAKRSRYKELLSAFVADKEVSHIYDNPIDGYYAAWHRLSPKEREAAEVYSLGKTLWCIFEGCADTRNSTLKAFKVDSGQEFPMFVRTPPRIRNLILQCVKGNRDGEPERAEAIRVKDYVRPRGQPEATEKQAMFAAKSMWQTRIKEMETFLDAMLRIRSHNATQSDQELLGYMMRPSLDEILSVLQAEEQRIDL
ncbi:Nn.00g105030.m01.CDS01 [Neocucurbitaria sp. VM-36]